MAMLSIREAGQHHRTAACSCSSSTSDADQSNGASKQISRRIETTDVGLGRVWTITVMARRLGRCSMALMS